MSDDNKSLTNLTLEQIFKAGFDAAWDESGEGFNGEYAKFRYTTYDRMKQRRWEEFKSNYE